MKNNINPLIIIPARGGSKGIPRKNLRILNGKPLIAYSISTSLNSKYKPDVYVSSEDDEILSLAKKLGSKVIKREIKQSNDMITLDPVVISAWKKLIGDSKNKYDLIITIQPTSPLLSSYTLDQAIKYFLNHKIDSLISVVDDRHLSWSHHKDSFKPNYKKRLNRQELPICYKETGGFLITNKETLSLGSRIGSKVSVFPLQPNEAVDIDNFSDWALCESFLVRKSILFVVSGYNKIGLGHVYNTLLIANDIVNHDIKFLVDKDSMLAFKKIKNHNYDVFIQKSDSIIDDIKEINPDLVINDRLDTTKKYITTLKKCNYKVINFEDLGAGSKYTDLTINAIYPESQNRPKSYFGHKYFILRDEFIYSTPIKIKNNVQNILLSFGGVDPNNLTKKVLEAIYSYCVKENIKITVVTGFGYKKIETLKIFKNIEIKNDVKNISDYMHASDIIFTSAGRTTYEIASLCVPSIVLAQNKRELTHTFSNKNNGFINLGLGRKVSNLDLLKNLKLLIGSQKIRQKMSDRMKKQDVSSGRKRVVSLIKGVIN